MIEENGIVERLEGDLALVRTERRSTCGGCRASGSCGTSLLDRMLGRRAVLLRAENRAGANAGDQVVVGVDESTLLRAAVLAYLLPMLALIVGAVLGQTLADLTGLASQLPALAGAAGAFALALMRLRRYSAELEGASDRQAIVLRRLRGAGAGCEVQIPGRP